MASLVSGLDDLLESFEDSSDLKWAQLGSINDALVGLTDWKIQVGTKIYAIHKSVVGDGRRQSKFFNAQFTNWATSNNNQYTDLSDTDLLPEPCRSQFEATLNYFYNGVLHLNANNVVSFFKIALALQMKHLAQQCVAWIKSNLRHETAIPMLQQAVLLSPGLEAIENSCIRACAVEFNSCQASDFLILTLLSLSKILQEASSKYSAQDAKVCHTVTTYVRRVDEKDRAVVFLELAKRVIAVPKEAAKDAMYLLGKSIKYKDDRIKDLCIPIVASNFDKLNHDDLAEIPDHSTVCKLLDQDELKIKNEDQVFDAIYNYCQNKDGLTKQMKEDVWSTCRFMYLSSDCAIKMLKLDINEIPSRCVQLALAASILKRQSNDYKNDRVQILQSLRTPLEGQRLSRRTGGSVELDFQSNFDENGVLYYIGTSGGQENYQNPHESGKVVVSASSMGQGHVKNFVQHKHGSGIYNHTQNSANSWFMVDLGVNRALRLKHYCLRSDNRRSNHKCRNWRIEGSNDADNFTCLRQHTNDSTLGGEAMSEANWNVDDEDNYYRYFRILQNGVNSSGANYLMCAGIEFYGELDEDAT
jgi:hypothetical protein